MPANILTDSQKILVKTLDHASDLCIKYAAPVVPKLENLTPEGLLEDFGRLNEARKVLEKTEKIVRARFQSQIAGKKELRGDNFHYQKEVTERTALNQGKAKEKLVELGGDEALQECMDTSEVERVTVKRN